MADLNQIVKRIKAGWKLEIYPHLVADCIRRYEQGGKGPLCCFYVCRAGEIRQELKLEGFENHADSSRAWVIGCSRGCILAKEADQDLTIYREKLCAKCVEDAREV